MLENLDAKKARLLGLMNEQLSRRAGGVDLDALRRDIDRMNDEKVDELLVFYVSHFNPFVN